MEGSNKVTCILIHPDPSARETLVGIFASAGLTVSAVCADWTGALDAAARVLPEMIFVHALAAGLDAGTATAQVDRLRLSRRPAIVYLVPSYLPERMTQGMRPRVDAHPDAETIRARVAETLPLPVRPEDEARAERLLAQMDIAPGENRRRLAYAVALVLNDAANAGRLKHTVYPAVAERFHTTPRRVEDGLRRAIDAAWTTGNSERQYALFGNTIDARRGKPTPLPSSPPRRSCLGRKLNRHPRGAAGAHADSGNRSAGGRNRPAAKGLLRALRLCGKPVSARASTVSLREQGARAGGHERAPAADAGGIRRVRARPAGRGDGAGI